MQIPIIQGIYTSENADYRIKYPHNLKPVALNSGISQGYLRPVDGVRTFDEVTPPSSAVLTQYAGFDRASINYLDYCYRLIGDKLFKVDSNGLLYEIDKDPAITISGIEQTKLDYSFDYLAFCSGGDFFLYNPLGTFPANRIRQNTDADLGKVIDFIFIDGFWMTTDGKFLVVTELGDPFSVNPLKYGSSELDPDPIVGLLKVRDEAYALNRYTVEAFYNKGGNLFPFDRIEGSRMMRGLVGTRAKIEFLGQIAFLGGGRNEPVSVWIGLNAETQKIATREIDHIIQSYTEDQLKNVVFEKRIDLNHKLLMIRLPDQVLCYDYGATEAAGAPVWYTMDYGYQNICWAYDKWIVGNNSGQVGYLDDSIGTFWDEDLAWDFQTQIIYNESNGAIIHDLELVGLPGRMEIGATPTIWTSYSNDGEVWSQEWAASAGSQGNRTKRLKWFQQGGMDHYRIQRFRGFSDARLSIARLEANLEALIY